LLQALAKKLHQIEKANAKKNITGLKVLAGYSVYYRIYVKTEKQSYRIGAVNSWKHYVACALPASKKNIPAVSLKYSVSPALLSIQRLFLLRYFIILNVLIISHQLIDKTVWCNFNNAIRDSIHKFMIVRSEKNCALKIF